MMGEPQIWIATTNLHKIQEFKKMLGGYEVKSLLDLPNSLVIEENGTTFCENALIKAKALALMINQPSIGDDSGLLVDGLDGFPGVYSRRWALPLTLDTEINAKLLRLIDDKGLKTKAQRQSRMVSCLAYYDPITKNEQTFEGELEGYITYQPQGVDGFGYDQVFALNDSDLTLAQIGIEKNSLSSRSQALTKLMQWLESKDN
ncbi:RdgB/HAM1 family non-canonical purine NTP pyrophosphatase [Mesoplasma whartonense]|uniref:RdgB/HAM1 family non-canonical purine NTP pyrophosphatase n=1 Tax=Mesoplasma whartonense TaxID=2878854 RepID=UPI002022AF7B|nr:MULTISPECIES: RdgB/HAM1 family non-canonical purine NTP pyrophosphatase [unclassified Mesoplasma]MCL8212880.1 dITP/XTP pyrophosphatase [Mesoplasma sp. JKS002661]MCL8216079.1 dITP/XTP pyrophosphatase [Mesoplasma sp. JKS002657]